MGEVLIRGLDRTLVERLKMRARKSRRSLQAEVKGILEQAANADSASARKLAAQIRRKLRGRTFGDSTALVRADRRR
jgi:plasmid stability protein